MCQNCANLFNCIGCFDMGYEQIKEFCRKARKEYYSSLQVICLDADEKNCICTGKTEKMF